MVAKFRVDAGRSIGLGHLIRCISVAQNIAGRNVKSVFFLKETDEGVYDLVRKEGFEVVVLPDNDAFLPHINSDDLVVLDGYTFTASYEFEIKKRCRRLVSIDDLQDRHYYADVIINHTPGINPDLYQRESYTKVYSGLDYSLLRGAVVHAKRRETAPQRLRRAFICMGGADPENHTLQAVHQLARVAPGVTAEVVVGTSYVHQESLNSAASQMNFTVHKNVDVQKLIELIGSADVAIASASTISLECVYLRIPLYIVQTADNQLVNYRYLAAEKMAAPISELGSYSFEKGTLMLESQKKCCPGNVEDNVLNAVLG